MAYAVTLAYAEMLRIMPLRFFYLLHGCSGSPTCSIGCENGSALIGGSDFSLKCDCNKKNKCKWKTDRNKKVKASNYSNYRCDDNNTINTTKSGF